MFGKLTSVVRSDGLEMLSLVWHEQPPYGLCQRHGFLAMLEFLHDEEVRAAFYHREDGVAVLVDNQVHLPVSEPPAVCLLRTFVYAYPVPDTRSLGYRPARGTAVILHLMAAVGGKCPTRIVADHLVNDLVGDLHALLAQVAGYLLGGPLLSGDELTHAPEEQPAHGMVARSTVHTSLGKGIGLVPDILAVLCRIAFQLTTYG